MDEHRARNTIQSWPEVFKAPDKILQNAFLSYHPQLGWIERFQHCIRGREGKRRERTFNNKLGKFSKTFYEDCSFPCLLSLKDRLKRNDKSEREKSWAFLYSPKQGFAWRRPLPPVF